MKLQAINMMKIGALSWSLFTISKRTAMKTLSIATIQESMSSKSKWHIRKDWCNKKGIKKTLNRHKQTSRKLWSIIRANVSGFPPWSTKWVTPRGSQWCNSAPIALRIRNNSIYCTNRPALTRNSASNFPIRALTLIGAFCRTMMRRWRVSRSTSSSR